MHAQDMMKYLGMLQTK